MPPPFTKTILGLRPAPGPQRTATHTGEMGEYCSVRQPRPVSWFILNTALKPFAKIHYSQSNVDTAPQRAMLVDILM